LPNVTFDIEGMRKRMNEYAEECEREERLYRIRKAGERKEGRRCRNGTREYRKNGKGTGVCYTKAEMPKDHEGTSGGDKSGEKKISKKEKRIERHARSLFNKDGFTERHKDSMSAFQDTYSNEINKAMRDPEEFNKKYENNPDMIKRVDSYIETLTDAFTKSSQKKTLTVFRGASVKEYSDLVGEEPSEEHKGRTFSKKNFTSTSIWDIVADIYMRAFDEENQLKFIITVPGGRGHSLPLWVHIGEKDEGEPQREILLAQEVEFEITEVDVIKHKYPVIYLKATNMKENTVKKESTSTYRELTPEEYEHLKSRVREIRPNLDEEGVENWARFLDRMRDGY